ncbi:MAG: hypothetical protein WCK63_03245 [Betaproteobacteria bacterium]
MSKKHFTFHESRDAFLKALYDYQEATLDMNRALQRISQQTHALYTPLKRIVHVSGAMVTTNRFLR